MANIILMRCRIKIQLNLTLEFHFLKISAPLHRPRREPPPYCQASSSEKLNQSPVSLLEAPRLPKYVDSTDRLHSMERSLDYYRVKWIGASIAYP